jgi:prophage regulatory protein
MDYDGGGTMRILRADEVTARTGLSRTTLWRRERAGTFPRRREIGPTLVGWIADEVDEWILERPVAVLGGADDDGPADG